MKRAKFFISFQIHQRKWVQKIMHILKGNLFTAPVTLVGYFCHQVIKWSHHQPLGSHSKAFLVKIYIGEAIKSV